MFKILEKRLHPLIEQSHPDLASKITAMLLEFDTSELLLMLDLPELLKAKIEEAVTALQAYHTKEIAQCTGLPRTSKFLDHFQKKQQSFQQATDQRVQEQEPLTASMPYGGKSRNRC